MKKYWYYVDEKNERHGPMSFNELCLRRILRSTLVWNESMSDWDRAENLVELEDIVIDKILPPLVIKMEKEVEPRVNNIGIIHNSNVETTSNFTSKDAWKAIWVAVLVIVSGSVYESISENYFHQNLFSKIFLIVVFCSNFYFLFGKYFKNYLNHRCVLDKANNLIYASIFSFVTINVIEIIYDLDYIFESEKITFIFILCIVLFLVFLISYIGLAFKLLFVKKDFSGLTKYVGLAMLFTFTYLAYISLSDPDLALNEAFSSQSLWYLFLTNLTYLVMIIMFISTIVKLKNEQKIEAEK
jgi:hypothetical protein